MLRRIIPTAERTVTRGGDKKSLTREARLENARSVLQMSCEIIPNFTGLRVAFG